MFRSLAAVLLTGLSGVAEPISPGEPIRLFNGQDLTNFYTFLRDRGRDNDPKQVFRVENRLLRISGEEWGCITTQAEYADYHLVAEFMWGDETFGDRIHAARDSGILLNSTGKDGAYGGVWMHSIECQLIEGGTGDLLVVGDKSESFSITCPTAADKDGKPHVYQPGGNHHTIHSGRIDWYARAPEWSDTKGFRGKHDIEHPLGQWNRIECVVRENTIRLILNGVLVNEAYSVRPEAGRIQIQSEGAEIFFRRIDLYPLDLRPDPVAYPPSASLSDVMQPDGTLKSATNPDQWAQRRKHILGGFQSVIGPLPEPPAPWPLEVETEQEEELPHYTRKHLSYLSEPGDRVAAWLLIPRIPGTRLPAALCLHQTIEIGKDEPAGLGSNAELAYGHELAERGYVVIAPDYPTFGENDNVPEAYGLGYDSITAKGIWNHRRAIDVLVSLPEVDPDRIAVIGHSLGGHNSLFVAAWDTRIKAAVTSCGFCTFPTYYGGDLRGWAQYRYMPRIESVYGLDPTRMPFDFDGLLATIAPRAVFISAPVHDANFDLAGVKDAIEKARPVFALHGASDRLIAQHPDAEHSFPREQRMAAYAALDAWLRPTR
jgi:dienelactone hydrolase